MSLLWTIVIILLLLMVIGSIPRYSYSRNWGYAPSGLLGTILIIILVLWLLGMLG